MSKSKPAASADKVEEAIKELKGFRNWGEQIRLGRVEDPAWANRYTNVSSKAEMAQKAKKVAELISLQELEELCALCTEHVFPLGVSQVIDTLSLDRSFRMTLLREAIKERWSVRDLQRKIRDYNGPPSKPGRPRNVPNDAADVYDAILLFYGQWRQLDKVLRVLPASKSEDPTPYRTILDLQICKRLKDADGTMRRLLEAAELLMSRPPDPPKPPPPKRKRPPIPKFTPPVKPNRS